MVDKNPPSSLEDDEGINYKIKIKGFLEEH